VVCPLTVLYSWCSELAKWAPSLKVLRLHASNAEDQAEQRRELVEKAAEYDVVVTTYEMVKVPQLMSMWSRQYFRYLVLDEGHKIKSGETLLAQAVRKLHCENRLLLTGTPLQVNRLELECKDSCDLVTQLSTVRRVFSSWLPQNNLSELVQLLNFLLPDIFTSFKPFEVGRFWQLGFEQSIYPRHANLFHVCLNLLGRF
jgi:SWI/SNF-related matrix-associated actin-dependent regulator of chromatin subfamily A member 5